MLEEVLDLLQVVPDEDYVDGTLGLAGHARAILTKSSPEGRILGIDRDGEALGLAGENLAAFGSRVSLRHGTFEKTRSFLEELGWGPVSGMVLDLGVSSLQLDRAERGFSFLGDAPLDMRMDPSQETTAYELVHELSEKELETIFRDYGEERFARRIARRIAQARGERSIRTTSELCRIVLSATPPARGKIHPATRVFQALRIVVNRELSILTDFLSRAPDFLKIGGTLVILSFHSLEDRIVKRAFRSFENYHILTKKPRTPSEGEIRRNPRARSAKLRAIQRVR